MRNDGHSRSRAILEHNRRFIPGGISSINRLVDPALAFVRGQGSHVWDADGKEYIDYHGAFAPQFLGFHRREIACAVAHTIESGADLFGSGPTELEGKLAEMVVAHIPWIEKFVVFTSGSEATQQAIRLARAATRRDHVVVMQGGYNGWYNDVACNLATPLEQLGARKSPGEYDFAPISAGIPIAHRRLVHPVNFNDLESVRYVCKRHEVAAVILEPVLQNVGVVKPAAGYLEGMRRLADEIGFLLIFDEVKTGFRHAFGGYAEVSGVTPDLAVYGKAIASGYPLGAIGGPARWLDYFCDPDESRRVLLAGTYNGHPVPVTAAIATLEILLRDGGTIYARCEAFGARMERGLNECLREAGVEATISRQGSAFVVYFMDHAPRDWHDLAAHHNGEMDVAFRRTLIEEGVYFFPVATKQCSISAAHSEEDIDRTIQAAAKALRMALPRTVR
jgi:glutamate-1-semialdehyde 2,1-aminomutase